MSNERIGATIALFSLIVNARCLQQRAVPYTIANDLKAISEKLEIINLQLAQKKAARRKLLHWLLISLCVVIVTIFAVLIVANSPYLGWNYDDPETAVAGAAFHVFEWLFVRSAPIILIGAIVGIFMTRKNV
ncbi:XRE family transcriptional regulator [Eubacteriales bacterium DFI.9.88]|nr:XRE family transcriptional regulator [Eubacteriales bacterium DFI.9.88]